MYIERSAARVVRRSRTFSHYFREIVGCSFTWLPFPETEKEKTGPYEQTQFASYNQSRESPEGLFSGRLHATNSSDEFAFRRDGGYHSQPFCGINKSIDTEKPRGRGRERRGEEGNYEEGGEKEGTRGNEDEQKYAYTRGPIAY